MSEKTTGKKMFQKSFISRVLLNALRRFNPLVQIAFPVLFVFYVGAIVLTFIFVVIWLKQGFDNIAFEAMITIWIIVLLTNFFEALFEVYEEDRKKS